MAQRPKEIRELNKMLSAPYDLSKDREKLKKNFSTERREEINKKISESRRRQIEESKQKEIFSKLTDLNAIRAAKAYHSYFEFIKTAWPIVEPKTPFVASWHIEAICEHIEAMVSGEIKDLIITIPPRLSKSSLSSIFLPAWVWLRTPHSKFLYGSYSYELAGQHARGCRRLMESEWYQRYFGDRFKITNKAEMTIYNDQTGHRIASSVKGFAVGGGGDYLIADDPHKILERESEAIRNIVHDWWDGTMSSRANDQTARRFIIMQRSHDDDLVGHVLSMGGDYVHINLPMEFDPDRRCRTFLGWSDPRTKTNELLCSDRFDKDYLAAKKKADPWQYSALYQQDPVPAGGGIIKEDWIQYYKEDPKELADRCTKIIQSWDTAFKVGPNTSYVVGQVWGIIGANVYLLDQVRGRYNFPDTIRKIKEVTGNWNTSEKLIEGKASGDQVVDTLKTHIQGLIPVPVKAGNKEDRLSAVSYLFEAGNIYIPAYEVDYRNPPKIQWVPEYISELTRFPHCQFNDQVDATSQALDRLRMYLNINYGAVPIGVGTAGYYNKNWSMP